MRWHALLATIVLAASAGSVRAREDEKQPESTKAVADRVVEACRAGDQESLRAVLALENPDPWSVVECLSDRGQLAEASALAASESKPAVAALGAYVEARRARGVDEPARDLLASLGEMQGWAEIALATENYPRPLDSVVRIKLAHARGLGLGTLKRFAEAVPVLQEAADAALELGWLRRAYRIYGECADCALRGGDTAVAVAAVDSQFPLARALEILPKYRYDLNGLCLTSMYANHLSTCADLEIRRVAAAREEGSHDEEVVALVSLGAWAGVARRYDLAAEAYEDLYEKRCQFDHDEYLTANGSLIPYRWAILSDLVRYHINAGHFGRALARLDLLAHVIESGDGAENPLEQQLPKVTTALRMGADLRLSLGQVEEAHRIYAALLSVARTNTNRFFAYRGLGRTSLALDRLPEAGRWFHLQLALAEKTGGPADTASPLLGLGDVALAEERPEDALECWDRAAMYTQRAGFEEDHVRALVRIARHLAARGDLAWAEGVLREALDRAETSQEAELQLIALAALARVRLLRGEAADALPLAERALGLVLRIVEGLPDEMGAGAKDRWSGLLDVGVTAAMTIGDPEAAGRFLEAVRAGALREALGVGSALQDAAVPERLAGELAKARDTSNSAAENLRVAVRNGRRQEIRDARAGLEEAQIRLDELVERAQLESRSRTSIAYPAPDSLAAIRAHLADGEALLLYGLLERTAVALVVQAGDCRGVDLGPRGPIEEAAAVIMERLSRRPIGAPDPEVEAAREQLRSLLVDPLELGPGVRRVQVSPAGVLGYVPFSMIMPEATVTFIPSGSTLGLIRADGALQGTRVLALGDPDYGAAPDAAVTRAVRAAARGAMTPLPATRAEAEAVGDRVLLGGDATEEGFTKALAEQGRWRSIHFACHGLIDPERPLLSALALTADVRSDGFLTCLEVLGMRIPADLVVLSACETGRGRLFLSEGIVGLTRAFMAAGAPRVLCSLWKVDDRATSALMSRFYDLWNPEEGEGLPAAVALRQAQEFVRSHEEWKQPYFWAAWVLWGLQD